MNLFKIGGHDIKNIFTKRYLRIAVPAIIITPLLYSLLYLYAFWDPYNKLEDMPVAVVNLDQGATQDGKDVNFGKDIVENLKDNSKVGWKFVSKEEADNGLEKNEFYAKFEIPKDFSKKVTSAKDSTPTIADLNFVCNEKKNFLAANLNHIVEAELKQTITKKISNNYVSGTFDKLYEVKDGMVKATDGSKQLKDGLDQMNGKMPELKDGINKLTTGVPTLYDGQVQLNSGILQLNNGLSELNAKVPALAEGISTAKESTTKIATGADTLYQRYSNDISPILDKVIAKLPDMLSPKKEIEMAQLKEASTGLSAKSDDIKDKSSKSSQELTSLIDKVKNLPQSEKDSLGLSDKDLEDMKKNLDEVIEYTDSVKGFSTNTDDLIDEVSTLSKSAKESVVTSGKTLPEIKDGIANFGLGLNTLSSKLGELNKGLSTIDEKVPLLTQGISNAYLGSSKLADGSNQLVNGQEELKNGVDKLGSKTPELTDGVKKLTDGSTELYNKTDEGAKKLTDGLKNSSEDMGEFVSEPLSFDVSPTNPVPNYGTGFAPYFIALSLWIGAIMMSFVIHSRTEEFKEASKFHKVFGKFISFGFIGILQAICVGAIVLVLGLHPTNTVLYFALILLFALVFISIAQFFISMVGDAGRLICIILLILQLTACAGTFPLELVPGFFKVLNPFMPFTYVVESLKEAISATTINYSVVGKDVLILTIIMIVFLTLTVMLRNFGERAQEAIDRRKSQAK